MHTRSIGRATAGQANRFKLPAKVWMHSPLTLKDNLFPDSNITQNAHNGNKFVTGFNLDDSVAVSLVSVSNALNNTC